MTANLQLILQSIVAITDANGNQVGAFDMGNPSLGAAASFVDRNVQATAAPVTVNLPAANVFSVLVQNVGVNPLQIRFTPNLGSAVSFIVGPTGFMIMHDPTETGTGFSQLSVSGLTLTVPAVVEVGA
jgi:hypothetical protein